MEHRKQEELQRLDQQFDFIREIDKEKFIARQTYLSAVSYTHLTLPTILRV